MVNSVFVVELPRDLKPCSEYDARQGTSEVECIDKHTIDDAIKHTGHGKFHFMLLLVCGFSLMGVVVENVNVGFVMPYVRCEMGITTTEQGLLNSAAYVGIVISSHMWGFLADTTGRHNVLKYALSGSFVCALLSVFSVNVAMLTVLRLFVGVFVSGVQAATYSYIGEFHSDATRTRAAAFVAMFMPACFVFLPILAWLIIPMQWEWHYGYMKMSPWRLFLLCSSLLNGINFICLWFLPESPKFLLSIEKKAETMVVLHRMYKINTGNAKETFPVKDVWAESVGTHLSDVRGFGGILKLLWNQTWPLFVPPHLGNTIKLCYLMFLLFSVGHGTFMWFPDFLTKMQDYTDSAVTLCSIVGKETVSVPTAINETLSVVNGTHVDCDIDRTNTLTFRMILLMGITFVVISAIISFYIDRIERKLLLTAWLLLSSGVCLAIAFIKQFYVMVVCFMLFLSAALCAGIISAISVPLFPANYRAMGTCLMLMFGRIGGVGGSNFVGLLLHVNCELIFYLYSGLILSCVVICYSLDTNPKEQSKGKKKKGVETKELSELGAVLDVAYINVK